MTAARSHTQVLEMFMPEVLFVAPSLGGGGAERVASLLANSLVQNNYSFTFLLTKSQERAYPLSEAVNLVDEYARSDLNPYRQIRLIRTFMRAHPKATVLSFLPHQNMYAIIASLGLANRIVISIRNDPSFDFAENRVLERVRNLLYRHADAIVFQTGVQMQKLPKKLSNRGKIILNPVDPTMPEPFVGTRRKAVVTSGRLEEQKNHQMTIRAFAEFQRSHPDYVLEIYGVGSKLSELQALALENGVFEKVTFAGFCHDARDKIRTASIFVMSSMYEGLSNAMLESLVMGVPTVCTRCAGGGAEAMIRDGVNGYLVDVNDYHAMAVRMCNLVEDDQISKQLSFQSANLRREVSVTEVTQSWMEVL